VQYPSVTRESITAVNGLLMRTPRISCPSFKSSVYSTLAPARAAAPTTSAFLGLPIRSLIKITSKGQVTIPQEMHIRLGLLPHTKVEVELAGDHARIRKARRPRGESVLARLVLEALRGSADTRMRTDEIMAPTRGEARPRQLPRHPLRCKPQ
jgi:antitoxin PrlF